MGFHAFEVSLEMIEAMRPVIQRVAKKDWALADQMRRAASSVPLNISEGSQRIGRDRQHAYRVAAGSARELRAALRVAQLWDYVDDSVVESVDGILDRELALLWGSHQAVEQAAEPIEERQRLGRLGNVLPRHADEQRGRAARRRCRRRRGSGTRGLRPSADFPPRC